MKNVHTIIDRLQAENEVEMMLSSLDKVSPTADQQDKDNTKDRKKEDYETCQCRS